jgi:hypothetical protein
MDYGVEVTAVAAVVVEAAVAAVVVAAVVGNEQSLLNALAIEPLKTR